MEKVFVSENFVSNPIASVFIFTYNQDKFISETIDSILIQETNFDFEIVLVDDCSSDKTADICLGYQLKYPNQIKFIANKKNKGLIRNYHESIEKYCKGKYIAQCAGDDYWVAKDKLQRQVSILKADTAIGLVHTQISSLHFNSKEIKTSIKNRNLTLFENLLVNNCISAPTVCFHKNLYLKYLKEIDPLSKDWIVEDTPMWLWFSIHSKIKYIDEPTVVYRIISGSISNTNSSRKHFDFLKSRLSIKKYFIDNYNGSKEALMFIYDDFYRESEYHALKLKEKETIKAIAIHYKEYNNLLKFYYFIFMIKMAKHKNIYIFFFFVYRVYYKLKRKVELL